MRFKLIAVAVLTACAFLYSRVAAFGPTPVNPFSPEETKRLIQDKGGLVIKLTSPARSRSGGTGFLVRGASGKVYTLTNGHICDLAEGNLLVAHLPGSDRKVFLRVLDVSETTDLCLLEPLPGNPTGLTLGRALDMHEPITILGYPMLNPLTISHGYGVAWEDTKLAFPNKSKEQCVGPTMSYETVRTWFGPIELCFFTVKALLTTAIIYGGNSGSPVFDARGNVVGVVFASDTRTNHGLIIPLDVVRDYLSVF